MLDQATLAQRLRKVRENARVTQDAAAKALKLPRTAVVQIEAAKRSVSSLELATLARLYGRSIDDFFKDPAPTGDDTLVALFRAAPGLAESPGVKGEVSRTVEVCRIAMELERALDRQQHASPPAYGGGVPRRQAEAVEQGLAVAEQERHRLGFGDAPVPDLADLLCAQGIWASSVKLPDPLSGFFVRDAAVGMLAVVNVDHGRARKRFSYAHEYAHALFDRDRQVTVTSAQNRDQLSEVRANAFAAAFLLPHGGVAAFLRSHDKGGASRRVDRVYDLATESGLPAVEAERRPHPGSQTITYQDVAYLAWQFGVSYKTAAYRLRNLGWVSQAECDALVSREKSGREYLTVLGLAEELDAREPRPDRELKSLVTYLATEAFRQEQISRGRLLEIGHALGIPGRQLMELARTAAT